MLISPDIYFKNGVWVAKSCINSLLHLLLKNCAICGRGNFILRPRIASPSLTGRRCQSRSGSASSKPVFSLSCEGVAGMQQSIWPTDGNLTVLRRPDTGKKLCSRRRPRADRTMTQNKKRKLWMCSCVWHCINQGRLRHINDGDNAPWKNSGEVFAGT